MTDYIERYSKEIGIDIQDKIEKGLEKPKVQFDTILTPFLNSALGELYKYKKDNVLQNKEGIINQIKGNSNNFFGAITELCVGGLFAPKIIKHSSPDYILSLNEKEIRVEVTNRISKRGKIDDKGRSKEHRSNLDKIDAKKCQHPNYLFICYLERAFEPLKSPIIRNLPVVMQSQVILTPGINDKLDNELHGIISYDITPLHINSYESRIISAELPFNFIKFLKQRFKEMFHIYEVNNVLFVLDRILNQAGPIND